VQKFLLTTVVIVLTVIGAYWTWVNQCYVKPFKRVVRGDTEAHIIATFGKPQYVWTDPAKVKEAWEQDGQFLTANTEIAKSLCYWPPLGGGAIYCIGFDIEGRVIAKSKPPSL
jgi:hypothetical protein